VLSLTVSHRPEELWYTQDEYTKITEKTHALVVFVRTKRTGNRKYCLRGLERWMSPNETADRRNLAYVSVFQEQDRQLQQQQNQRDCQDDNILCCYDPLQIASAYKLYTVQCRIEAIRRAKQDEVDAMNYIRRL
jgi:hypothetical protein